MLKLAQNQIWCYLRKTYLTQIEKNWIKMDNTIEVYANKWKAFDGILISEKEARTLKNPKNILLLKGHISH